MKIGQVDATDCSDLTTTGLFKPSFSPSRFSHFRVRFFIQFHLSNMIIYKDIFTGDEMFSDSYPMKVVDEVMYEVTGKYISVKHGDIQLAGSNPSAEDAAEETDEATESGCDIVMAHRLAESFAFGDKKSYTQYLKDYVKRLQTKLVEDDPKFDLDSFKTNMNKVMKELIGRFKDLQFFTGMSIWCR